MEHTVPAPKSCPICLSALEIRPSNGGMFLGCTGFIHGCSVSWSFSSSSFHGLPSVVAPASTKRSRCVSKREEVIAQLMAMKGFERNEAVEFLDAFGLVEVQAMLAAA